MATQPDRPTSSEKAASSTDLAEKSIIPSLRAESPDGLSPEVNALARKARWKFDSIVLPVAGFFYFCSFLDRANIGNARTAGLAHDLHLTPHQYSVVLTITYVPYMLVELPSNILLKKFGANVILPIMVVLYGIISIFQGFVTSYEGLLAARFFLGLCEGGLLPGCILWLSAFYERQHLNWRTSLFISTTSLAGAFSGLAAYGISHMHGVGGKAGWRWIFILEGIFTFLVGVIGSFFMPRTPEHAKFLTPEELEATRVVLEKSALLDKGEPFSWREVFKAITDPIYIPIAINTFFDACNFFGLAFFIPTLVNSLGYSPVNTQLYTVPPYACACVAILVTALISDRIRMRGVITLAGSLIAAAGFALFLGATDKHVRYGSFFLSLTGSFLVESASTTWVVNLFFPYYRRASIVAVFYFMSSTGGILSTWLFDDPPLYRKGTIVNLVFAALVFFVTLIQLVVLKLANDRKRREQAEFKASGAVDDEVEKRRLGDRHRDFLYMY